MSSILSKLSGTGVALVTPFTENHDVDYTSLEKHICFISNNNINYLVVLGTTAETPTLSAKEKLQILATTKRANKKKLPIILGIGGNDTKEVIEKIKQTDFSDIDALLSVTPYYNKPSQAGLCKHYTLLADISPVPIILYNVPGRTGINLSAESTLLLAQHKNTCGLKDASANLTQMGEILRQKSQNFAVISGDDAFALPQMAIGAVGVISVIANLLPNEFSKMITYAQSENFTEARKIHLQLLPTIEAIFSEGNPVGVKAGLSVLRHMRNNVRLPLVEGSDALHKKLSILLNEQTLY